MQPIAKTADLARSFDPAAAYERRTAGITSQMRCAGLRLMVPLNQQMLLAYAGLLLFVAIYFGRPEDWIPGLSSVPLAKSAAGIAIISFILAAPRPLRASTMPKELFVMLGLFGQLCLAVPFAYYRTGSVEVVMTIFLKVVLMSVVVMLAVNSESRLRKLLFVQTSAMGLIAAVSSWKYGGGRASGVLHGDASNPNDLALSLTLAIPFAIMFFVSARGLLGRAAWGATSVVLVYTTMITYSRGGFLALLAAAVASLYHYRSILIRRPLLVVLCGMLGLIVLFASPVGYGKRLATIIKFDHDDSGSGQQRRFLLDRSIELTLEHPLLGVGPGNFESLSGVWRVTHNTYTELSSEAGVPAMLLFVWLLTRAFKTCREVQRSFSGRDSLYLVAVASQASLCALTVGAFFSSLAYHFVPYLLIAYSVALRQIANRKFHRRTFMVTALNRHC